MAELSDEEMCAEWRRLRGEDARDGVSRPRQFTALPDGFCLEDLSFQNAAVRAGLTLEQAHGEWDRVRDWLERRRAGRSGS